MPGQIFTVYTDIALTNNEEGERFLREIEQLDHATVTNRISRDEDGKLEIVTKYNRRQWRAE